MTVSEDYRRALETMHEAASWGTKGFTYAGEVRAFAAAINAATILDYGCGKQTLAAALADLDVLGYDPGIPALAGAPAPADLVVTTDVLEHVEPDRIDETIAAVFALARRGVYHAIALNPAKQVLPDGRNAHLIIQPAEWWMDKLMRGPGWRLRRSSFGVKKLVVQFTPL